MVRRTACSIVTFRSHFWRLQVVRVGASSRELSKVLFACSEMAALLRSRKPRRAADKAISVRDLCGVLERWFEARGSRDLSQMLMSAKAELGWKRAPRASPLAEVSDLIAVAGRAMNGGRKHGRTVVGPCDGSYGGSSWAHRDNKNISMRISC